MYEDHYRFHRQPFSPTPDPEFFYKSDSHQQALEQLLQGIRRREGILLLTGDVGTGKTTTTRALVRLLDKNVFTALVLNPFVSEDELLRVLLQDFGVVSDSRALQDAGRQSLVETLNRFLLSLAAVGASALAVVDEAQNLTAPVLEQLRVLTGLETDQQKLLQILLVGQPELQTMLALPEMRQLNQRIARRCTLRPLTRDEVDQYVAFRVRLAGGAWETIFTRRALDLIYQVSEGVPRKINLVCDRSLEMGFAALSLTIDEALVAKAAEALEFTGADRDAIPSTRRRPRPGRFVVAPQTKRSMAAVACGGGGGCRAWCGADAVGGVVAERGARRPAGAPDPGHAGPPATGRSGRGRRARSAAIVYDPHRGVRQPATGRRDCGPAPRAGRRRCRCATRRGRPQLRRLDRAVCVAGRCAADGDCRQTAIWVPRRPYRRRRAAQRQSALSDASSHRAADGARPEAAAGEVFRHSPVFCPLNAGAFALLHVQRLGLLGAVHDEAETGRGIPAHQTGDYAVRPDLICDLDT